MVNSLVKSGGGNRPLSDSTECANAGEGELKPGAGLEDRPFPKTNALPGVALEPWAARHNEELWQTGPDGTWRNQADGTYDDADPADIDVTARREPTGS